MDLILDPRAMADHLVAPRHQPAKPFGCRIGRPDLGQIAGRIERQTCFPVRRLAKRHQILEVRNTERGVDLA
jgi:hypothetical protein